MQQRDGLFITIEGTDGSGKDTQARLLEQRLQRAGYDVVMLDFPRRKNQSSYFVQQYIRGAYGSSIQVGPYTACLFYALDYYDAAPAIRKALSEGKAVIAKRFGGSNMANQGAKISHPEERRGFFIWLDNLQFRMLNMPRPTMSFVLRVPADIAQERIREKHQQTVDSANEAPLAELDQLQLATNVYDDMCQLFPKDFIRIDCVRGSTLLEPQQINDLLWGKLEPLVPEVEPEPAPVETTPTVDTQPVVPQYASLLAATRVGTIRDDQIGSQLDGVEQTFYIPQNLDEETKHLYTERMGQLVETYTNLTHKLHEFAATDPSVSDEAVIHAAQLVLPAAILVMVTEQTPDEIKPNDSGTTDKPAYLDAISELQKNYSDESEPNRLVSYWPRNELDIVPAILYEYSNQSLQDIQRTIAEWPYDKKSNIIKSYVAADGGSKRTLESVLYTWDVLTEFAALGALTGKSLQTVAWQPLSPRLGYDIPALIERAGLADDFERSFDLSLELYSALQAAGYRDEAQYATLLGHRTRAKITASAHDVLRLSRATLPAAEKLVAALLSEVAGVHPLLVAALQPVPTSTPEQSSEPPKPTKPKSKRSSAKPPLDK